jgi:pSer/pThr/pTyr-binding forkhead associated (FHA) protein
MCGADLSDDSTDSSSAGGPAKPAAPGNGATHSPDPTVESEPRSPENGAAGAASPSQTGATEPVPEKVVFEVGDVDITATDGDTIGRKIRSAYVRTGAAEEEAQYIHREHVKIEREGTDFYLVNKGKNGTKLNGTRVPYDERRQLEDGDTVEFSGRATGEVQLK